MLIWARANFDNLVYTVVLINTGIAVTFMIYNHYRFGLLLGLMGILFMVMAIIWNE